MTTATPEPSSPENDRQTLGGGGAADGEQQAATSGGMNSDSPYSQRPWSPSSLGSSSPSVDDDSKKSSTGDDDDESAMTTPSYEYKSPFLSNHRTAVKSNHGRRPRPEYTTTTVTGGVGDKPKTFNHHHYYFDTTYTNEGEDGGNNNDVDSTGDQAGAEDRALVVAENVNSSTIRSAISSTKRYDHSYRYIV